MKYIEIAKFGGWQRVWKNTETGKNVCKGENPEWRCGCQSTSEFREKYLTTADKWPDCEHIKEVKEIFGFEPSSASVEYIQEMLEAGKPPRTPDLIAKIRAKAAWGMETT